MQKFTAVQMLGIVADGLKGLEKKVVFVGGATVALYVDDPAVSTPRPTDDVDCTVEITSRPEYYQLEKDLQKLGFKNKTGGSPICRWTYSGVTVDFIPSQGSVLGFSNIWYVPGIANSERVTLQTGLEISIFSLPYFIASKFEAYNDRGNHEPRTSSDFEDIVFVLDGCRTADQKLLSAPSDVRTFLAAQYNKMATDSYFSEAVSAHLENDRTRPARSKRIIDMLESL